MDTKLEQLKTRLNRIQDKIASSSFLSNEGIGNEIGFYIFDYPPQFEVTVREHIEMLIGGLNRAQSDMTYVHVNLFTLVVEYLKKRGLLEEVIALENSSGTKELLAAFDDILSADTLCDFLVQSNDLTKAKAILISGVGSCWPFVRAHTILNNLQNYVGKTPVILFYPGQYTGQDLKPFGIPNLKGNYYRAFPLIDEPNTYERGQ
jgi:hypothetical protein